MDVDVIPESMRQAKRWLLWRNEGEGRKVPYYTNGARRTGALDSDEDRSRLSDLTTALNIYGTNQFSGLGFALGPDGNGGFWQGVDFDHVPDNPMLQDLAHDLPGYVETSPSGAGLHAIGRGRAFRTLGSNSSGIEAYCKGRYFTVTGQGGHGDIVDVADYVEGTLAPLHSPGNGEERAIPPAGDSFFAKVNSKALASLAAWVPNLFPSARPYHDGYRVSSRNLGRPLEEDISILPIGSRDFGEERGATPIDLVVEWGNASTPKDAAFWLCSMMGVAPVTLGWSEPRSAELGRGSAEVIGSSEQEESDEILKSRTQLALTDAELESARLTPTCFIHHYLYAQVALLVAAGGTGKTTLLIKEAIHLSLGLPLYGLDIEKPGWTLFFTKEDERELIAARVREIMTAMNLDAKQRAQVMRDFVIVDVTGTERRLVFVSDGNIVATSFADEIVEMYKDDPPAQVVFDPLISFGASESMVNDNEQAIINVCRRIMKGLGCCVRLVHHIGKSAARENLDDQYAGRGGSALADGARMVVALRIWDREKDQAPPQGLPCGTTDSVMILRRPKLSYAPPNLPLIWISRTNHRYEHMYQQYLSPAETMDAHADQLLTYLEFRLKLDRPERYAGRNALVDVRQNLNMTARQISAALSALRSRGDVVDLPLPEHERHGRRKTFLCPAEMAENYWDNS